MNSTNQLTQAHTGFRSAITLRYLALGVTLLVLVVVYVFWPYQHWQFVTQERGSVLGGWAKVLTIDPEWYFCFVVPPIVGFLVYRKRKELATLPMLGTWWGLLPAAASLILFWIGYKVDTGYMGYASIQLMTAALILLFGGMGWMRALLAPWLFLVFAWPMYPLESLMASPLRLFTAKVANVVLNFIGIPMVREGTGLHSAPDFSQGLQIGDRFRLDVANPCSGIRSLFSLMMISVLYGVVAVKHLGARCLLFISAIPLAVTGNLVRLILLALGSVWFGQDFAVGKIVDGFQAESFYHEMAGYIVFAVALSGMFGIATFLEGRRHWKGAKFFDDQAAREVNSSGPAADDLIGGQFRATLIVILVALTLFACAKSPTTLKMAEPGLVMELPANVGSYQGAPMEMSALEKVLFDEGVSLSRRFYVNPSRRRILATLVLSGPVKKSLHEPTTCLPGQGWTIGDAERVTFKLADGREQSATLMHIFRDRLAAPGTRMRQRALNLYWYQGSHGVSTSSFNMSYTRSYLDSILRNLNHRWGQANFWMPISERQAGLEDPIEEADAKDELLEFLGKLTPEILAEPAA